MVSPVTDFRARNPNPNPIQLITDFKCQARQRDRPSAKLAAITTTVKHRFPH